MTRTVDESRLEASRWAHALAQDALPIIGFILVLSGCVMVFLGVNSIGLGSWMVGWGFLAYTAIYYLALRRANRGVVIRKVNDFMEEIIRKEGE